MLASGARIDALDAPCLDGANHLKPRDVRPGRDATMIRYTLIGFGLCGLLAIAPPSYAKKAPKPPARPNILFVVMDDVGIDQLAHLFPNPDDSYAAENQLLTPNIDSIAHAGVRFGNTWAMPACSTSRAVFFTGRFPFRTHVLGGLGPLDLANSMVSPFETTSPKLLAKRGYASAALAGVRGESPVHASSHRFRHRRPRRRVPGPRSCSSSRRSGMTRACGGGSAGACNQRQIAAAATARRPLCGPSR
jgi:hypothetical protein